MLFVAHLSCGSWNLLQLFGMFIHLPAFRLVHYKGLKSWLSTRICFGWLFSSVDLVFTVGPSEEQHFSLLETEFSLDVWPPSLPPSHPPPHATLPLSFVNPLPTQLCKPPVNCVKPFCQLHIPSLNCVKHFGHCKCNLVDFGSLKKTKKPNCC